MKRYLLSSLAFLALAFSSYAQLVPDDCQWMDGGRVAFLENGSYTLAADVRTGKVSPLESNYEIVGGKPVAYADPTLQNWTDSPDGVWAAYTRDGNLWTCRHDGGDLIQRTFDGSETVYNGWASWVYYEEIFGRPSRYKAFWWSPDSRKLAFYRFDDTEVL